MRAMILQAVGEPLREMDVPTPVAGPGQVLVEVRACGVCRTDLHVVDGELSGSKLPLIPGHEVVGLVVALGSGVERFQVGERVGLPWVGWTCGECRHCRSGRENLCDRARFNGHTLDGGYAEFMVADARYCLRLPESYSDDEAAPLLCAGLIGYRSLMKSGPGRRLGIYGFGGAAHIVVQVARSLGREVYAFTRPGDEATQQFARELGAVWAGDSNRPSPVPLDAAIIFAPVGELVVQALKAVDKGGTVVCGGIHMSDIPSYPYSLLWGERTVCSVANLTRQDGESFLSLAPRVPVRTRTVAYPLSQANLALSDLRGGKLTGAAVLVPG